jgi:hypothetical protein
MMVKIRQFIAMQNTRKITYVGFSPPSDTDLAIEAMTIDALRKKAPADHFEKLQRADFYRLIGVCSGKSTLMVDFSDYPSKAGDWLLIRPGQVMRYDFSHPWSGWLLVFRPEQLTSAGRNHPNSAHGVMKRIEDMACLHSLGACRTLRRFKPKAPSETIGSEPQRPCR